MIASTWNVDPVKILTRLEITGVLHAVARQAPRSRTARMDRVIVRLACCRGLRVSEIAARRLADVCLGAGRPHLRIGLEGAKGQRARIVPLWRDAATLADLVDWDPAQQRSASDRGLNDLQPAIFSGALRGSPGNLPI